MNTHGRPSLYTPELADEILQRLATGESLRSICRDTNMPPDSTVRQWVVDDREGFSAQYARAREMGLDSMADEMLEIADDGRNDWMEKFDNEGKSLGYVLDGEHVQRSKLRLDARRWYLSKLAPKRYGDKQTIEHTGADGGPVELNDNQAAARLAAIMANAEARKKAEEGGHEQ